MGGAVALLGMTIFASDPSVIGGSTFSMNADGDDSALRKREPMPLDRAKFPEWLASEIERRQPTPAERRIDEIGWADDILTARRLSRESGRPMFLFTLDGRIRIGRC
jgi:hypothetical protein